MAKVDNALVDSIRQKITESAPFLEAMPGVIIVHNLRTSAVVYMNTAGLRRLEVTLQELEDMGAEYHNRFFNETDAADYAPKVMGMLARNNDEESVSFFQQVRAHTNDSWEWHGCCTRVFMRDAEGAPLLILSIAMPVDPKHYFQARLERMVEEKEYSVKNAHLFAALGNREKQILTLMAKDFTSKQIADELSIAEDTVKTHRRNIKRKLAIKSQYDLLRFAQTFDLV